MIANNTALKFKHLVIYQINNKLQNLKLKFLTLSLI